MEVTDIDEYTPACLMKKTLCIPGTCTIMYTHTCTCIYRIHMYMYVCIYLNTLQAKRHYSGSWLLGVNT